MPLCLVSRLRITKGLYLWNVSLLRRASTDSQQAHLDFPSIDAKWRQRWAHKTQESGDGEESSKAIKSKFLIVPMFPYPSGTLHMGHLRVYTISDVLARANRMWGRNVLHPIAWDAFGLPAENAAIERGVDPAEWTKRNIKQMKDQLQAMNGSFDWSREFATCDPSYYKHTQRIFLKMYERGIAYQAESLVNFDPVDRTVLANEQVDPNGFSWRSGAKVEKKSLKQWFLKIKNFQDHLHDGLEDLRREDRWPDRVVSMQRNWIGKPLEVRITFPTTTRYASPHVKRKQKSKATQIVVESERPDLLHGVQYLALSARHPLVVDFAGENADLMRFIDSLPSLPADTNAGFLLPGIYAENPLAKLPNPLPNVLQSLPVYVTSYLTKSENLTMMGVPGHDLRDRAFWVEHRPEEDIHEVITPHDSTKHYTDDDQNEVRHGTLNSLCGDFKGLNSSQAAGRIFERLCNETKLIARSENWRLRDWLISRQRYWGTPIPVIHCPKCGPLPVPVDQLPVELPKVSGDWFKRKRGNPLEDADDWINVTCHQCGSHAKRETDTMDTFMDSSWYFMRYLDPANTSKPFSPQMANDWLPVDIYVGGVEHAILHLLYARFVCKFLATNEMWPLGQGKEAEPFQKLITQGMVHGKTFSHPETGRFLKPEEIGLSDPSIPKIIDGGQLANISWEKMSKSKYNGVDPMECIQKYGADVTRAHILFQAPVTEVLEWDEGKIVGIQRWFRRIWRLTQDVEQQTRKVPAVNFRGLVTSHRKIENEEATWVLQQKMPPSLSRTESEIHTWTHVQRSIASVRSSLETTFTLNTVISDLMELTNTLTSTFNQVNPAISFNGLLVLLRMLAPIAPAFAEECWETLHASISETHHHHQHTTQPDTPTSTTTKTINSILDAPFPTIDTYADENLPVLRDQVCILQEDGKKRLSIKIIPPPAELLQKGADKEALQTWMIQQIRDNEAGSQWMNRAHEEGKIWERIVVAPGGGVVNFVSPRRKVREPSLPKEGAPW